MLDVLVFPPLTIPNESVFLFIVDGKVVAVGIGTSQALRGDGFLPAARAFTFGVRDNLARDRVAFQLYPARQ